MILLNKTMMMCGGLVILSPDFPAQVLCAIFILQFHMLLVLKTAPYINDSKDWSSFLLSLGLTLMYVGALVQMLQSQQQREEFDPKELSYYAGIALATLPVMCISIVVVIMIFVVVNCRLWNFLQGMRERASKEGVKASTLMTQVKLINSVDEGNNGPDTGAADAYPMEAENLRAVLLKFGASRTSTWRLSITYKRQCRCQERRVSLVSRQAPC